MAGRKRRYKNYLFDDEAEVPKRTQQYYDSEQRNAAKNGRDQMADRINENNAVRDLEGHNNQVMSEDEQEGPRDFERLDEAHGTLLDITATEETEAESADESEHDVNENNEANDLQLQCQERVDTEIILDPDLNYDEAVVDQNKSQEGSNKMESDDDSDLEPNSNTSDSQIIYTTNQHHEAHTERVETFAESNDPIVLEDVHQDQDINNQREEVELGRASSNRLCMGNKPRVLREELEGYDEPDAFEIPNNDTFELNEEPQPWFVDEEEPLNIDIYADETNEEQQGISEDEDEPLAHETNNETNEEEHGMEQPHPTQLTHLKLRQELQKEKFITPIMTPVTASPAETLLMTLAMAEKNNSTFKAFVDSIRLINSLFSCPVISNSAYLLDKLLNASEGFTKYFYCSKCCFAFGIRDSSVQPVIVCAECGHSNNISNLAKSSFFVLYPIAPQIELLFMDKKIRENLSHPKELVQKNLSDEMKDLYDGQCYKRFVASLLETMEHAISFTVSTDGSPVFRLSSNFSIWPFFVCINELPPLIRMKNPMLAGLWFGNKKPHMDLFLEPLVDDLLKLETGFKILFNTEEIIMHAYVIACCVDSGARGAVQGLNTHSGYYSCNWCEIPGEYVDKKVVFPFPENPPQMRTQASVVQHATECINDNRLAYVFGVRYLSPLVKWTKFNIVDGMVLDYAHNVPFGISRTFLIEWLETTHRGSYIGAPDDLNELDRKMLSLTPPLEIRRPVRKITDHANWNAREFENWTLVFSIIVLTGILPSKYLNNWICLVQGMFLLSRQGVTSEHINSAQKLFLHFVRDVEVLYGKSSMSYNCHILGHHMAENVLKWGPAWAISTFCFENAIKTLKGLIHAQRGVPHQINRSLSYKQAIHILKTTLESEKCETFEFCLASKPNKQTKYFPVSDCVLTGNFSSFSPNREENYLLQRSGLNINVSESSVFNRMIAGRCVYTTDQATVSKKHNNVCASTIDGKLVIIKKIVLDKASEEVFIFCVEVLAETFLRLPQGVRLAPADHCLRFVTSIGTKLMLLSVKTLKTVNVFTSLDGKIYVGEFPNIYNVF